MEPHQLNKQTNKTNKRIFVCYHNICYHFVPDEQNVQMHKNKGKKTRENIYSLTLEPHFIIFVCSNFFITIMEKTPLEL